MSTIAHGNPNFFRLHHVRPRFKNNVESVLNYMAAQVVSIGTVEKSQFKLELGNAVRRFPGNAHVDPKTVANWRTEICSLFGLVMPSGDLLGPTPLAVALVESGDLIAFFRQFLMRFQYPGGHVQSGRALQTVQAGVRFLPAATVIGVLLAGQASDDVVDARFGLSKAEATHLIWNDLRVTRDQSPSSEIAARVIQNRKLGVKYDDSGDVVRYAGDILDYMVLADLLVRELNGRYYLKASNTAISILIRDNSTRFTGYDKLYSNHSLQSKDFSEVEEEWFHFAGETDLGVDLGADPIALLANIAGDVAASEEQGALASLLLAPLQQKIKLGSKPTAKDIGDSGEAIAIAHEQQRLTELNRSDLSKKVKKIPDHLGVGFDVLSFTGLGELQKFIEVKTSVSHGEVFFGHCHLTPSEWSGADTHRDSYFIFRIHISTKSVRCFVIQDPVGLYKKDKLNMVARNGADLTYLEEIGVWEDLLV